MTTGGVLSPKSQRAVSAPPLGWKDLPPSKLIDAATDEDVESSIRVLGNQILSERGKRNEAPVGADRRSDAGVVSFLPYAGDADPFGCARLPVSDEDVGHESCFVRDQRKWGIEDDEASVAT